MDFIQQMNLQQLVVTNFLSAGEIIPDANEQAQICDKGGSTL